MRRTIRAIVYALSAGLAACGGSGGGGGSSSGGGGGSMPPTGPLVYSGATSAAVISPTNAAKITANVVGSGDAAGISAVAGVSATVAPGQTTGAPGFARRFDLALRTVDLQARRGGSGALAGVQINQTDPCDSGTVSLQGTISDANGTGTATVTFSNCRTGTDTLNGAASMQVDAFDTGRGVVTDFTLTFTRVTFSGPGVNADVSGTLRSQIALATNTETLTENFVSQDNGTRIMTKTENMIVVNVYNNVVTPSSFSESVSGRVFDGIAGYVDLTTNIPLFFSTTTQSFPDTGQAVISGAGNSRIRFTAVSSTLAKLEVDANGDGTFENTATLRWLDLSSAIGADLRDNDGDGMHNGWETAFGLDPNNAGDARLDKDGDGASNLAEYLAGTDPTDASSRPLPVALALAMGDGPDPVVVGATLTYLITVTNSSATAASNVVITDTLPAGVTLSSVLTPQGSCSVGAFITCALGTVNGFGIVTVTVIAVPGALGVVTNSASVTTSSYEPNLADNTAAADTTVGPVTVDIALSMTDTPDPVSLRGALSYTITAMNFSSNAAANVVVTDTLPAGFTFVSASSTQGSCSGTGPVTCSIGTLAAVNAANITINGTPTVVGAISNMASVTTSSVETNLSNNTATATTTVGAAAAGLQAMIDAASPGQTIIVDPGLYAGGINFNGKNITLQSRDGPATTVISGTGSTSLINSGGTVVTMGPGGTLAGFTITGGTASFGAGVSVGGSSSLITGNIFDGNAEGGGGYGAAIGGNSASPTIERNIFRNNTCDTQFLSGAVTFVNFSSPRIVNNVFENNPCAAVNVIVPQSNTPQIVNNTFVGNRVGVRILQQAPQTSQTYRNNIFVGNGTVLQIDFSQSDGDNPVWTNNLVFGNTVDYVGTGSKTGVDGNISADPLFVNQAAGDYHLQAGSSAIDAGSPLQAPATDFDGVVRPRDGNGDGTPAFDVGAFEH